MKITCKTTLLPFVGTRLRLRIAEDGQPFAFYTFDLAWDSDSATVNWGDGTVETVTDVPSHTYAKAGEYEVRITDDVADLGITGSSGGEDTSLCAFYSNATQLEELDQFCFNGCMNLVEFDIRESGVRCLNRATFRKCTGLSGELFFPRVGDLGTKTPALFSGCTGGITKIHFSKANEEAITESDPYQADHTLGTGTAEVVFDP